MSVSNSSQYFKPLTGVRILAAYFVFIHHYKPFREYNINLSNFSQELHIGVTMFFVLSGFLIAHRYMDRSKFDFKAYMIKRFARIYPMYFILTSLTFLFLWISVSGDYSIGLYLANISFLKGFFSELKFTGLGQGWSLTVEEVFYITAPFYFMLIRKNNYALVILPIVLIGIGVILVGIFKNTGYYGFFDSYHFMFGYTFFGRCTEFFIGIGLCVFIRRKGYKRINPIKYTHIGLLIIIACIYSISLFNEGEQLGIYSNFGRLINNLILPLFGISFFYYGLIHEKTYLSRLLGSKYFGLLGKSSYVFYLIHVGAITEYINYKIDNLLILFVMLNLVSILLYKFIEEPLNRWLNGRLLNRAEAN